MVRGILVTHGQLGRELLQAAAQIYGQVEGVAALGNDGLGLVELRRRLEAALGEGEEPVFVFLDVVGGSCCHAALALREAHPRLRLVAGVNLPMILEFLHHRGRVGPDELLERVLSRGRDAVREP